MQKKYPGNELSHLTCLAANPETRPGGARASSDASIVDFCATKICMIDAGTSMIDAGCSQNMQNVEYRLRHQSQLVKSLKH